MKEMRLFMKGDKGSIFFLLLFPLVLPGKNRRNRRGEKTKNRKLWLPFSFSFCSSFCFAFHFSVRPCSFFLIFLFFSRFSDLINNQRSKYKSWISNFSLIKLENLLSSSSGSRPTPSNEKKLRKKMKMSWKRKKNQTTRKIKINNKIKREGTLRKKKSSKNEKKRN